MRIVQKLCTLYLLIVSRTSSSTYLELNERPERLLVEGDLVAEEEVGPVEVTVCLTVRQQFDDE